MSHFFELIQWVGRLMFVALLFGSAIGHLTQTAAMAPYAESKGLSNAKLMVQISGVAMVVGGLSILLGIWGDMGALGIAILLIIIAVQMHAFWKETDPMAKQMEMANFNKNIALAGAALFMWAFFHYSAVPWTITDALIGP